MHISVSPDFSDIHLQTPRVLSSIPRNGRDSNSRALFSPVVQQPPIVSGQIFPSRPSLRLPELRSSNQTKPSSRRVLTKALELARTAVKLDSNNVDPRGALIAYGQSVALLKEVIERVEMVEDIADQSHMRVSSRRRSVIAQEDEVRRLKSIHDTYADRINILSLLYDISPLRSASLGTLLTPPARTSELHEENMSVSSLHGVDRQVMQDCAYDDISRTNGLASSVNSQNALGDSFTWLISVCAVKVLALGRSEERVTTWTNPYTMLRWTRVANILSFTTLDECRNLLPAHPCKASMECRQNSHLSPFPHLALVNDTPLRSSPSRQQDYLLGGLDSHMTAARLSNVETAAINENCHPLAVLPPSFASLIDESYFSPEVVRERAGAYCDLHHDQPSIWLDMSIPRFPGGGDARWSSSRQNLKAFPIDVRRRNEMLNVHSVVVRPSGTDLLSSSTIGAQKLAGLGVALSSDLLNRRSVQFPRHSTEPLQMQVVHPSVSFVALPGMPGASSKAERSYSSVTILVPPPPIPYSQLSMTPPSPLPSSPPQTTVCKTYHVMYLLRRTIVSNSGGYITRRLHIPCEVWSQGGAKLPNVADKVRVVEVLCHALQELQSASADFCGAFNVANRMTLRVCPVDDGPAMTWILKLDEFLSVCDGIAGGFGKKLAISEHSLLKRGSGVTSWGGRFARQFDKLTNGKNLDSPSTYVQGLSRLFQLVSLFDVHVKALRSSPMTGTYASLSAESLLAVEFKMGRISSFFASVVLTFVMQDLSLLLEKYTKKCEKWLAE